MINGSNLNMKGAVSMPSTAAKNNDINLGTSGAITITGALSGTGTLVTLTPYSYTADKQVLKLGTGADTTLANEYSKFGVTQQASSPSVIWRVDSTGYLRDKYGAKTASATKAVGDIVFKDGSATSYTSSLTLSDELKAAAIAVIFYVGTDCNYSGNTTSRTLGIGLKKGSSKAWCIDTASAYSVKITSIECSASLVSGTSQQYAETITGDKNGSDNLSQIGTFLSNNSYTNDTSTAANYPAFYYCKNYGTNYLSGTSYTSGWYLPSLKEWSMFDTNSVTVNNAIALCGGAQVSAMTWTSSQANSAKSPWYYLPGRDFWNNNTKNITMGCHAIREF